MNSSDVVTPIIDISDNSSLVHDLMNDPVNDPANDPVEESPKVEQPKNSEENKEASIDDEEAKEDSMNRIMDLFNEESDTQVLDAQTLKLASGFENFNEEVGNIFRAEEDKLRKDPDSVFRNKSNVGWSAMEQNKDPVFYSWYAFSLTMQKIVLSLTHSLSGKVMEHSDISLTPKCMLSLLVALDELKKQKTWVVKMLDTTGKAEFHNILDGSIISLGGYDQCLAIESPKVLKSDPGVIYGKYCLVKYDIPLPQRPQNIGIKTRLFNFSNTKMEGTAIDEFSSFAHALYEHKPRVGFCIPSQCQMSDLQTLLDICKFHCIMLHSNFLSI